MHRTLDNLDGQHIARRGPDLALTWVTPNQALICDVGDPDQAL